MLLVTIVVLCFILISFLFEETQIKKLPPSSSTGGIVNNTAITQMAKAHTTDFFVKEFIIVTRGKTHVWWKAKGVMDYELYKIAYHTGDTVYFNGDKVLYVVDVNGKQWR